MGKLFWKFFDCILVSLGIGILISSTLQTIELGAFQFSWTPLVGIAIIFCGMMMLFRHAAD